MVVAVCVMQCFFECYCYHRDLHVRTHSYPTRRSSDLCLESIPQVAERCGTRQQRCAVERSDLLDLLAHGNGLGLVVFLLGRVSGKFLLAPLEHGIAVLAEVHPKARSEEHTSELQSLMRKSYAVFCLKKKKKKIKTQSI